MGCFSAIRRGCGCALLAGLVLLMAPPLRAQQDGTGVALENLVSHSVARPGYRTNDQLNRADCEQGDIMSFPLVVTNAGTNSLEAWAGTGCQAEVNRTSAGTSPCWKLVSVVAGSPATLVNINVRDLLWGYTQSTARVASGSDAGTPPTIAEIVSGSGREVCDASLPVVTTYQLYFMLTDPNQRAVGTIATYTGHFKLLGPPPPDELHVTAGSNRLALHFSYLNNQVSDSTSNGFEFFCDPAPGAPASVGPDAGCAESAPSAALVPQSSVDPTYECGTASLPAQQGTAQGLTNGAMYHVAVAAVDTYQNIGPLSNVACAVPEPDDETVTACSFSARRSGGRAHWGPLLSGVTLALWQVSRRCARARGAARLAPPQ